MEFQSIYKKYINNNYFPLSILESTIKQLFNNEDECRISFDKIKQLYKSKDHSKFNESQLEDDLIKPILKNILGYEYLNQETISIQGKQIKPDYLLFESNETKNEYIENKNIKNILVVFEAKEWNKDLDGKKIKDSPHLQLVTYNLFLGLEFGILSNGQKWRFYDLRERKSEKIFYEINVHSIVEDDNYEAFKYFYYVFRKQYFLATESNEKNVE